MYSILKDSKISKVEARAAAGTTDLESDILDMSGFDSVMFIASTGDATSGTVLELQVFGNTSSSTSGATEITANSAQFTSSSATDADNKLLVVDVHRPAYRYVYAVFVIDTQNCEGDGIYAIQYNAKSVPVTADSDVIASALVGPSA